MEAVKVHGFWASPFSQRVLWALKLKGVSYEYIEENLINKSELLLKYNPIHRKIPVLVHGEKVICESRVILEYIEETWPEIPLLPADPLERATARFWLRFGADKGNTFRSFFGTTGEEQQKAAKEEMEKLRMLEVEGLGDKKFFGGDAINLVDIAQGWLAYWFESIEQVVGVKLLEPTTLPRLHAWAQTLKEIPEIKSLLPDRERLLAYHDERHKRLSLATYKFERKG